MARPRGNLKAATGRARKQDNLSSLSTEVLRLRLQALNLPITGSKADLVSRLQAVQHPRAAPRTKPGRVQKRSARQRKDRPAESQPAVAVAVDFDGDASEVSSGSSVADLDDLLDFPQSGSRADQETSPSSQPFTETQMAAIQDTVRSSLEQALQSFPFQPTYLTNATPATSNLPQRRPGAATPLGLTRPLDKSLTDKILRGEYIDFTMLLPDSLTRPQTPDIQLRLDDSVPGSSAPLTMVRKRKPVIDTFHKWLDAYTAYMLVIVESYPRRSLELLKYQQIISRAATKFKGLAFLSYDEQFRRRAAYDLTLNWDQVDLELWTVTFSGLAKPHCLVCSSPYHSQSDCPSADPSRPQPKSGPVCFRFNRSSGCASSPCPFPHVCRRCRSSAHSIINCPSGFSKSGQRHRGSNSSSDRSKR